MDDVEVPDEVRSAWTALADARFSRIAQGLINPTFLVEGERGRFILQRLHPVFGPEVHEDIEAVTAHLARKGLLTPRLVRTGNGALWTMADDGPWRVQTFVAGRTFDKVASAPIAEAAGAMAGAFHRALDDLEHDYRFTRGNVHDTESHLATLAAALEAHPDHALFDDVAPIASDLLAAGAARARFDHLSPRHAHGDLKISNVRFAEREDRAVCSIDLDTLSRMIFPFELGDALRSWCNPRREDQGDAHIDEALFDAALAGYARGAGATDPDDTGALVEGLATICLELSARFLADALGESYFGWDAERYPSRGAHNLARGRAMWTLHQDVRQRQASLERTVAKRLQPR